MKGNVIIKNCKVLDISTASMEDSKNNKIEWFNCVFMQDSNVNTLTVDKQIVNALQVQKTYDLVVQCSENPKNGYINTKFKITGIDNTKKDVVK